jgi:polyisoprenoid-binding protein YceI
MYYRVIRTLAIACGLSFAALAGPARAADYEIDLSHAFIQFRISHLGYSALIGRFNQFEGKFVWEKDQPQTAKVEVSIDMASLDSNWAERDKHLRGPDYLDVKKYPTTTFKSTKYEGDAASGKLHGNLTLHGVTRAVVLDMKSIGEGPDPWGGYRAGFEATTTLRLKDFGMDFPQLTPAAETMELQLFVEGLLKAYKPL